MLGRTLRAVWQEPRLPAPARLPWWDRAVVAVGVPAALAEGLLRDDVPWPPYSVALAAVCVLAVLWRTRYPLAALLVCYGAQTLAGVGPALAGRDYGVLNVTAVVLLPAYSVARWGSGRQAVAGVSALLAMHLLREPLYGESPASIAVGVAALLFPAALGAAVRFWLRSRRRESEQVRLRERERLARELHDTVAHHVSGIVLQAQAGRAVAATDPQRALGVLPAIEDAATRSLTEMRSLVGLLRDAGAAAERAPAPGVGDLRRLLAGPAEDGGPPVALSLSGPLDRLGGALDAAVYRVVQEAVTNARRHARGATRIEVSVVGADDAVRVEVRDDGMAGRGGRRDGDGYGLVGMSERVQLLGGRLSAGPRPGGRGWRVSAVLPRESR